MVLALGSNVGDRKVNMERAVVLIGEHIGAIKGQSGLYRSGAWGFEGSEFLNMVLVCETELGPRQALNRMKVYEKEQGREKTKDGYEDRLIDIDIIYYGDRTVDETGLHIPHWAIALRRFVLAPLAEILPKAIHPTLGLTSLEMLERCMDETLCERLK